MKINYIEVKDSVYRICIERTTETDADMQDFMRRNNLVRDEDRPGEVYRSPPKNSKT